MAHVFQILIAATPTVLRGLVHKGGLRAQILAEGEIQVSDLLHVVLPKQ